MTTRIKNRLVSAAWVIAVSLFVILSFRNFGGFPLDDGWIHQTYARNLAVYGEWSFIPGQISAGSTAPLWSLILAVGYFLNAPYMGMILILGGITSIYLALTALDLIERIIQTKSKIIWIGVFVILFDWRHIWASLSGMETLLYTLSILLVMNLLFRFDMKKVWHPLLVGAVAGLTVWLRPEGITILGPILWVLAFSDGNWQEKAKHFGLILIGLAALLIPYAIFNISLAGEILPNTFAAKQTEYASLLEQPLLNRIMALGLQLLVGVGIALVPGVLYEVWYTIRQKQYQSFSILLWGLGVILIYAVRLPVTYQHGRYIMPAISILLVYGLLGFVRWWGNTQDERRLWAVNRAWLAIIILLTAGFWWLGAQSYARDVAIIESEMVDIAHWTVENLPEDALIAAHDIGALGYFGKHKILDLAGLISPEVIPFMRDEVGLAAYLDEKGADYLITFEGWYPALEAEAEMLYSTNSLVSQAEGSTNMAVYRWSASE